MGEKTPRKDADTYSMEGVRKTVLTEQDIQCIIGHGMGLQNIVIPNVRMSVPGGWYEADLLYINKNNFVYEIEIKVDYHDFLKDFYKRIYHASPVVRGLYYAFPRKLYERYKEDICQRINEVHPKPGIIICEELTHTFINRCVANKTVKAISGKEKYDLMRLGCMKWWSREIRVIHRMERHKEGKNVGFYTNAQKM